MALIPAPPPDASSTRRGLVSLLAQSFAGVKTFLAGVASAGVTPIVTNASTLGTALLRWANVHTHAVTFADGSSQTTKAETSTLASVGAGASLVSGAVGPALAVRSIRNGTGISAAVVGDEVEISATLTTKGVVGGQGVAVAEGALDYVVSHNLQAGPGIIFTDDPVAKTTTIATPDVTLVNAGTGATLVNDGVGPDLALKSLFIGKGLALVEGVTFVRIEAYEIGPFNCTFPNYTVQRRSRTWINYPDLPANWTAWSSWATFDTRRRFSQWGGANPTIRRSGTSAFISGLIGSTDPGLPSDYTDGNTQYEFRWASTAPDQGLVFNFPAEIGTNLTSWRFWAPSWGVTKAEGFLVGGTNVRTEGTLTLADAPVGRWLSVHTSWYWG